MTIRSEIDLGCLAAPEAAGPWTVRNLEEVTSPRKAYAFRSVGSSKGPRVVTAELEGSSYIGTKARAEGFSWKSGHKVLANRARTWVEEIGFPPCFLIEFRRFFID